MAVGALRQPLFVKAVGVGAVVPAVTQMVEKTGKTGSRELSSIHTSFEGK